MLATEMFSGKPDAGNPPVRFEEGEDDQHRAGLFPTRLHNFVLVVEPLLSPLSSLPTASSLTPSAARRPVVEHACSPGPLKPRTTPVAIPSPSGRATLNDNRATLHAGAIICNLHRTANPAKSNTQKKPPTIFDAFHKRQRSMGFQPVSGLALATGSFRGWNGATYLPTYLPTSGPWPEALYSLRRAGSPLLPQQNETVPFRFSGSSGCANGPATKVVCRCLCPTIWNWSIGRADRLWRESRTCPIIYRRSWSA